MKLLVTYRQVIQHANGFPFSKVLYERGKEMTLQ